MVTRLHPQNAPQFVRRNGWHALFCHQRDCLAAAHPLCHQFRIRSTAFCCCSWVSEGKPANLLTPAKLLALIISCYPAHSHRVRTDEDVISRCDYFTLASDAAEFYFTRLSHLPWAMLLHPAMPIIRIAALILWSPSRFAFNHFR